MRNARILDANYANDSLYSHTISQHPHYVLCLSRYDCNIIVAAALSRCFSGMPVLFASFVVKTSFSNSTGRRVVFFNFSAIFLISMVCFDAPFENGMGSPRIILPIFSFLAISLINGNGFLPGSVFRGNAIRPLSSDTAIPIRSFP